MTPSENQKKNVEKFLGIGSESLSSIAGAGLRAIIGGVPGIKMRSRHTLLKAKMAFCPPKPKLKQRA